MQEKHGMPGPNRKLRLMRDQRHWSQEEAAAAIGVDRKTYIRWEQGQSFPQPKLLDAACKVFGVSALALGFDSSLEYEHTSEDESAAEFPQLREDWGEAPFVRTLYGRNQELEKASQWVLVDKCSIIALLGIGGIGKTSLAAHIAESVKHDFEYVFWRSLQNAPSLKSILRSCIHFLSHQQQIELPESLNEQILILLNYLRAHRCLIVLDNMESILEERQAGAYRPGYDEYATLLQYIGQARHKSCLLLTSREKVRDIARLEGQKNPVRSFQLSGLEISSGRNLLHDTHLFGDEETWDAFIQLYAGNPLYLKLASEPVQEVFGGDIAAFLKKGKSVLGDIRDPLDLQFARLSDLEKSIMYWLMIEREAITLDELQDNYISQLLEEDLLDAVWSLRRRFLIEADSATMPRFFLQPVIMEYTTDRFIQEMTHDIRVEKINGLCMSHALIKAQAKDYVRNIQIRLILSSVVKQLLRDFGEQEIELKLQHILALHHNRHTRQSGYLAGNILNMLVYLNASLQSFDFSRLPVRQAYLRGTQLPDVNFAQADLTQSVFTDTFGSILTVALSPTGNLLAAGTANGEIRLWKVHDGTPLTHYTGHRGWVWSVAFNADETQLVSGSEDETVRIWDVQSGKCIAILSGHTNRVRSVTFSPDATLIASGSEDQTIRLWDSRTHQCLKCLEGYAHIVRPVAFSPDGTKILNGGDSSSAWFWDVASGHCVKRFEGHNQIWSVAFSPNGKTIATAGDDEAIQLWDVETETCLRELQGHTNRIWSVSFGLDGDLLASGSDDKTIRLWHIQSGECFKTLQGHTNRIWSVAASSDSAMIASGSDDQTIRLWDARTGASLNTLQGHTSWIWSIAWSLDGNTIASCDEDLAIRLWDVNTDRCLQVIKGHTSRIRSVVFALDGKIVSCSEDQTTRLWSDNGTCLRTFDAYNEAAQSISTTNRVWSVAYNLAVDIIATGNEDHTVRLWSAKTGECMHILKGHAGWVWSVSFSPDGTFLVSSGEDATIRIWDTVTGECKGILQGHKSRVWSVAVSNDGNFIASGSDDHNIFLWDLHTQQHIHTFEGHTNHVRSVSFSPDNTILASASEDHTIKLWDLKALQHLHTLEGHTNRVLSVGFNPDGSKLASGGHDGSIMIWDTKTAQRIKMLRPDRPYERMDITEASGLTEAQRNSLKSLGAFEK
ncbi:MAG: helix-turn-helix domain-containing protein [Ktedonobacteraceae bacterium]|nr:helix-turn-helix domain-containing protein [Ktedonobacteraceae bacterium]